MFRTTILSTAAAFLISGAALAQTQEGLVNVNVTDVAILNDLQLQAPITVQAPIGIAAAVCGVDANVLAQQSKDDQNFTCEAENNSQAFSNLVARQQGGGGGQGGGQGAAKKTGG